MFTTQSNQFLTSFLKEPNVKTAIFFLGTFLIASLALNIYQHSEAVRQEQRDARTIDYWKNEKDKLMIETAAGNDMIVALRGQINDLKKAREAQVVIETQAFKVTLEPSLHVVTVNFRDRLVTSSVVYDKKGLEIGGSPTDDKRVQELADEIRAMEGIMKVRFNPHEMVISWANMFQWKEFEERVISILKAKFPFPEPSAPTGGAEGGAEVVPTIDAANLIQNALNAADVAPKK